MSTTPFSIITVFNDQALSLRGNPCAVVLLDEPWTDEQMQRTAADLNQPATSFIWKADEARNYYVRWFAPDEEILLCGHGTLATVAFLSDRLQAQEQIVLQHRTGMVSGKRLSDTECRMTLNSLAVTKEIPVPPLLPEALGIPVVAYYTTPNKNLVVVESEKDLRNMKPDFAKLRQSETFGYIVTALGEEADFVSRTLIPHVQQLEDHATGSSHAVLAPFWADRMNKSKFLAYQLSPRGGKFTCEIKKESFTQMTGQFKILAQGTLYP
jgi:PhzF family phenazine biosynthesis protein